MYLIADASAQSLNFLPTRNFLLTSAGNVQVQLHFCSWQVEQKPGGRGREWATLGVHPLSWLLSNNRLEKVPFVSMPHTSSNWLLLSNQDKGCKPSVVHSLALPLGPALLNLWSDQQRAFGISNIAYCNSIPSEMISFNHFGNFVYWTFF